MNIQMGGVLRELMQYPGDATTTDCMPVSSAHSSYSQYHPWPLTNTPSPIFLTLEIIATLALAFYSDPRIPGSPDPNGGSWFGPWRSSSSWAPLFVATNAVIIIYTVSTFYGVAILKCN